MQNGFQRNLARLLMGGREGAIVRMTLAARYASMFNANKRDWIDCIKSRRQPFCGLELGHRTATICNLGNMSLRLGGRTIHWDPEKEVVAISAT